MMPDNELNNEKDKIKARIMSEISRLKTVSSAEAKDILAGIRNDIAGFPDLSYLVEIAAEYVRNLEIKENNANNPSIQQTQTAINNNLWDIIEKEKEIISIKADVGRRYAEIDDLYNKSKSKDIKEASVAIEAILQHNSPEQLDNLAQAAVQIAENRRKQLKAFEEIRDLNGDKLDKNLNAQYKTLKKTAAREKTAFTANIQQRLEVQVASDLAKDLEGRGLINLDDGKNNAVRVLRAIEEDQNIKVALAKGASEIASSTFGNPSVGNACSEAFKEAKDRVKDVVDREKLSQKINAKKAQEEQVAVSAIQTASSGEQHRGSETTQNSQAPKAVLAQEAKKTTTESIGQSGNTKGEASSSEKSNPSEIEERRKQAIARARQQAQQAAKPTKSQEVIIPKDILEGLKDKPKITDLTSPKSLVLPGKPSHADTVKQERSSSSNNTTISRYRG